MRNKKLQEILKSLPDDFDVKIKTETGCDSWGINYMETEIISVEQKENYIEIYTEE